MDCSLPSEHEILRRTVRDAADRETRLVIEDLNRREIHDGSLLPKMASMGLLGSFVPVRRAGPAASGHGAANSRLAGCGYRQQTEPAEH